MIKFIKENYDVRYNTVQGRIELKNKNEKEDFEFLTDRKANSILVEMKNTGVKCSHSELHTLLNSDYAENYDPISEYVESIEEWDGSDHIDVLAQTVKVNNQEYFNWAFKKWFVAMVACATDLEVTNHCAFVLVGQQGCGKTTWIENLIPDELKPYLVSKSINPSSKDSVLLLSEKILINMDELANFNSKQIEAYKELITKTKITERRVYERFSNNFPRRASFAATTNHESILPDQSGNRRFLVFKAEKIDYEAIINLRQAYAQARSLIEAGFKHYFDRDDQRRVEIENERFRQVSSEEELILQYFEVPNEDEDDVRYMNSTELIYYLRKISQSWVRINVVTLGKVMTALGFDTMKKDGLKKYIVKLK